MAILDKSMLLQIIILMALSNPNPVLNENTKNKQAVSNTPSRFSKVVHYYQRRNDSLGVRSAKFLIENMNGLMSVDQETGTVVCDENVLTEEYLIRSINQSLDVSRKEIINKNLSEEVFFQHILPYRLSYEQLTNWKALCISNYGKLLANTRGLPFEERATSSIRLINDRLINTFTYDSNALSGNFQTWKQLYQYRRGDCWAMTNMITFSLRAFGVPVTIDFITGWANSNGASHAWNVFVKNDRRTIPFMGFEASPPNYDPFRIYKSLRRFPVKVYRKVMAVSGQSLREVVTEVQDIPAQLDFDRVLDVTDEYLSTKTVKLTAPSLINQDVSYLSLFSKWGLAPVVWARGSGGVFTFLKMGTNGLYSLTTFSRSGCESISYPFSVNSVTPRIYKPNKMATISIRIKTTSSVESRALSLYGKDITKAQFFTAMEGVYNKGIGDVPKDNTQYNLYYWDKKWVHVQKRVKIAGAQLIFTNVPSNAVYKLSNDSGLSYSRVFTYNNSEQIWW
ncbi:transglutaminase-like domain-containing protein [Dyadobacter sp. CY261]|uniref:transglutaminase-like domain-containing protein n=1 Tax=Dyadobacter sp. CY261 TaxID=2907203 RepID=UPI001F31E941|nr:transglutaminase-like domain-containing protein [Dyadobacter sp. CY261]MCF0075536.1 transglutaminase-like domain-containing protein [Dyadobacter sp. CY261]